MYIFGWTSHQVQMHGCCMSLTNHSLSRLSKVYVGSNTGGSSWWRSYYTCTLARCAFVNRKQTQAMSKNIKTMHSVRIDLSTKARWIARDCIFELKNLPMRYVPGSYGPDTLADPEFHSRCLPLDWAYNSLCTGTNLFRCQNGRLSQPYIASYSQYIVRGTYNDVDCPRCHGGWEIPVFDTTGWCAVVVEF